MKKELSRQFLIMLVVYLVLIIRQERFYVKVGQLVHGYYDDPMDSE